MRLKVSIVSTPNPEVPRPRFWYRLQAMQQACAFIDVQIATVQPFFGTCNEAPSVAFKLSRTARQSASNSFADFMACPSPTPESCPQTSNSPLHQEEGEEEEEGDLILSFPATPDCCESHARPLQAAARLIELTKGLKGWQLEVAQQEQSQQCAGYWGSTIQLRLARRKSLLLVLDQRRGIST